MAWSQLSSPGCSWSSWPLGSAHNSRTRPDPSNFANSWSLGGQPNGAVGYFGSVIQGMGEEPQTQISSFGEIQMHQGTSTFCQTSRSLPEGSKTWTHTLLRSAT